MAPSNGTNQDLAIHEARDYVREYVNNMLDDADDRSTRTHWLYDSERTMQPIPDHMYDEVMQIILSQMRRWMQWDSDVFRYKAITPHRRNIEGEDARAFLYLRVVNKEFRNLCDIRLEEWSMYVCYDMLYRHSDNWILRSGIVKNCTPQIQFRRRAGFVYSTDLERAGETPNETTRPNWIYAEYKTRSDFYTEGMKDTWRVEKTRPYIVVHPGTETHDIFTFQWENVRKNSFMAEFKRLKNIYLAYRDGLRLCGPFFTISGK